MRTNVFAYTPVTVHTPPYISINDQDGMITVTVRGEGGWETAMIQMPIEELLKMAAAVNTHCFPLQKRHLG